MKQINYIFTVEDGIITVQTTNVNGPSCVQKVEEVLNAIGGQIIERSNTDEYYRPPDPNPAFQHDFLLFIIRG